jgi:hypothetical protein
VGRFVRCLIRGEVQVVGFTDAPIPWPLGKCRSRPAVIVYGDLARAVRLESAAAIGYWWDVSAGVVWRWRKALGVGRMDSPGSRRQILAGQRQAKVSRQCCSLYFHFLARRINSPMLIGTDPERNPH